MRQHRTRFTRPLASVSLIGLLGLTGGWVMQQAIAPTAAYAYLSRVDVVLDVQPGESFETFLNRAESVARAATQRSFDRDILISEVYVIIVGQRNGGSVQVLSLQTSRNQWRSRPDPRRWATYYQNAKLLLGFVGSTRGNTTTAAPAARPTVTTPTASPTTVIIEQPAAPAQPTTSPRLPGASPTPTPTATPTTAPTTAPTPGTTVNPSPSSPPSTSAPVTTPLPPTR